MSCERRCQTSGSAFTVFGNQSDPENELEYSELMARDYRVASEILGENRDAFLYVHAFGIDERDIRSAMARTSVVLLNPTSGAAYDGGADVFVTDSNRVHELKLRWAV